jgi:acyl carrier protein
MFGIEKFLFEKFPKMPFGVRVLTYLVLLALFVYLVLQPRFIDGQLIIKEQTSGGLLPYRGADLQLLVDGRPYKFRSNEDGFFSIPLISRMPESVELHVFHVDRSMWFPVRFSVKDVMLKRNHSIEVLSDKPFVRLAAADGTDAAGALDRLAQALTFTTPAHAQSIKLPANTARKLALPTAEAATIRAEVAAAYAKTSGMPRDKVSNEAPLVGTGGLAYAQRIQLITTLERRFSLRIDDEHWQSMTTVGQLTDYMVKRTQVERAAPNASGVRTRSWPQVQEVFSVDERPTYGH